jgi:hypothetical protein
VRCNGTTRRSETYLSTGYDDSSENKRRYSVQQSHLTTSKMWLCSELLLPAVALWADVLPYDMDSCLRSLSPPSYLLSVSVFDTLCL